MLGLPLAATVMMFGVVFALNAGLYGALVATIGGAMVFAGLAGTSKLYRSSAARVGTDRANGHSDGDGDT